MRSSVRIRMCFAIAAASMGSTGAFASGTCAIKSVTLASQTYTNPAALSATGSVNWSCTRSSNKTDGSPTTLSVTADPGTHYANATRNAFNVTNLPYALSTASAAVWGDGSAVTGSKPNVVTASFSSGSSTSASGSFPFTFTMAASLNPYAGRSYTDSVSIGGTCSTANGTACTVTAGVLSVSVYVQGNCSVSSPPVDLAFNYTSFQIGVGRANSQFAAQCDNGTPYRMSLSPTSGTLLALPYSLALDTKKNSTTDISSTTTYNLTGNGLAQTYFVNGTIPAGLAGTCATSSCLATSSPHTLTLSY